MLPATRSGQGPGDHQQHDLARSMQLERARAFVERSAGGHDVVDEKDAPARQVARAMERAADVLLAFFPWQTGLGRSMPDSCTYPGVERQPECCGDGACQFQRLVEAAFAQPGWVQRQRDDEVGGHVRRQPGQFTPKIGGKRQAMAVFEGLDQLVQRKSVIESGQGSVVMWRMCEATPAQLSRSRGQGAARAAGGRKPWQVVGACPAENFSSTGLSAEQAILREEMVYGASGKDLRAGKQVHVLS